MNSQAIQQLVLEYAQSQDFSAPYGVLSGEHTSRSGRKYLSVTFGRARTLDATVEIYNRNFLILRTSRSQNASVFRDVDSLMQQLAEL